MYRRGWLPVLVGALALVFLAIGCGPSEEELAEQERVTKWAELQEAKAELSEARGQYSDLLEEIATAAGAEDAADDALATLESEAAALKEQINSKADAFNQEIVNFINSDPMVVGEEPTERQQAAIRLKSEEDILLAQEYVSEGGDYRRALDILSRTAEADPDFAELNETIEKFTDYRYARRERFDQLEEGMSQAEVREIMGQVYHGNVREYEAQGALAWFYPKDPEDAGSGAASAVFFRKRDGDWAVYQIDWEAVESRTG